MKNKILKHLGSWIVAIVVCLLIVTAVWLGSTVLCVQSAYADVSADGPLVGSYYIFDYGSAFSYFGNENTWAASVFDGKGLLIIGGVEYDATITSAVTIGGISPNYVYTIFVSIDNSNIAYVRISGTTMYTYSSNSTLIAQYTLSDTNNFALYCGTAYFGSSQSTWQSTVPANTRAQLRWDLTFYRTPQVTINHYISYDVVTVPHFVNLTYDTYSTDTLPGYVNPEYYGVYYYLTMSVDFDNVNVAFVDVSYQWFAKESVTRLSASPSQIGVDIDFLIPADGVNYHFDVYDSNLNLLDSFDVQYSNESYDYIQYNFYNVADTIRAFDIVDFYNDGYQEGYDDAYQAKFDSSFDLPELLWKVFSMPFRLVFGDWDENLGEYINGLFTFTVLGIDFRALVLGLLSAVVIIRILGYILGRQ